jgi:excisionase family DNA binding protein
VIDVSLDELPIFLTVEEAASVLRIGRTSAYVLCHRWRASGGETGLPCVQVGRQLRVPRSALMWMAETPTTAA